MATSITHVLRQIKDGPDAHMTPVDSHGACPACGPQSRDRLPGPVLTVQALLVQIVVATAMTGVS